MQREGEHWGAVQTELMNVDRNVLADVGGAVLLEYKTWGDEFRGCMRSFWRGINDNLKCYASSSWWR